MPPPSWIHPPHQASTLLTLGSKHDQTLQGAAGRWAGSGGKLKRETASFLTDQKATTNTHALLLLSVDPDREARSPLLQARLSIIMKSEASLSTGTKTHDCDPH